MFSGSGFSINSENTGDISCQLLYSSFVKGVSDSLLNNSRLGTVMQETVVFTTVNTNPVING